MVRGRSRPRIDVERHAESFESVLDDIVVLVNDILRLDSLLARLDRDGHAVLVGTAYGDHVRAPQAQVPHINIRRNVYPRKVSDMHRPVGIRERRCDKIAFKLFIVKVKINIPYKVMNFSSKTVRRSPINQPKRPKYHRRTSGSKIRGTSYAEPIRKSG